MVYLLNMVIFQFAYVLGGAIWCNVPTLKNHGIRQWERFIDPCSGDLSLI